MKKILIFLGVALAVVLLLSLVLPSIRVFRTASVSMEPTLPGGSLIISYGTDRIQRLDIVTYLDSTFNRENESEIIEAVFIGRVIALPLDTIEIRDGSAYVNGKHLDRELPLKHGYKLTPEQIQKNRNTLSGIDEADRFGGVDQGYMIVFLADTDKALFPGHDAWQRLDLPLDEYKTRLRQDFIQPGWTTSNFGPLVLDRNQYFIMGDNRDNSEDSRMRGCIPLEDIIGKVIGQ